MRSLLPACAALVHSLRLHLRPPGARPGRSEGRHAGILRPSAPAPPRPLYETVPNWGNIPDKLTLGPTHGSAVIDKNGLIYVSTDSPNGFYVFKPDGTLRPHDGAGILRRARHADPRGERRGVHLRRAPRRRADREAHARRQGRAADPVSAGSGRLSRGQRLQADRGRGRPRRLHLRRRRLRPVAHPQVRQHRQVHQDLRREGQRRRRVPGLPRHRARHPLRQAAAARSATARIAGSSTSTSTATSSRWSPRDLRRPCAVVHPRRPRRRRRTREPRRDPRQGQQGRSPSLGDNPDKAQWAKFDVPVDAWKEGIFTAPHGLTYDKDGNLYVQDWNKTGRVDQAGEGRRPPSLRT